MRKQWLTTWTLIVAVTGCAVPGMPGAPFRTAQYPQQAPHAGPDSPSWTQRAAALLPGSKKQSASQKAKAASVARQRTDPISLGFDSGPPTLELFLSMAQLSDRGGNVEHARSMYRQAISLQPNNLEALLGLARLEDRQGRLDEAQKIYQQAVAAHPQNAKALNDLGLCYARSGQLPDSLQLLDQAVRLHPDKVLYRNNIAKLLTEMDRVDEAVVHLSAVHPPAIAQYNMGVLLEQRGRSAEAIHFLTAASHIDPQLQAASEMLAKLQGNSPVSTANDNILPTPMMPPNNGSSMAAKGPGMAAGPRYSSSATSASPVATWNWPQPQTFPAETAQVPMGNSPVALPPVR